MPPLGSKIALKCFARVDLPEPLWPNNESKVFLFDETAKVFSHAKELEQIGLRVPQVTKIMMKLHENGYPVDPAVFTLEQAVKEILPLVQRGAAND